MNFGLHISPFDFDDMSANEHKTSISARQLTTYCQICFFE